ncbi:D-aspartate oxidase isoform X5 [Macaca nemestrina]|uniref:D-aspartate oxidase isoform X5 n=1 Tax=Macaca nemestrina TaxID=9545 RepID=UPI0039B9C362
MDDRDSCAGQWKGRPGECPESSHQWEAVSLSLCLRARDQPGTAKQVLVPETLVVSKTAFSETGPWTQHGLQLSGQVWWGSPQLCVSPNWCPSAPLPSFQTSLLQIPPAMWQPECLFLTLIQVMFPREEASMSCLGKVKAQMPAGILEDTPIHTQKQWFRETFNHLFAIANSAEAGDAGVHLVSGIKGSGGWMLTRRIDDLWELYPSFDIVVNCSGLGSRQLAGDAKIFPVRGQVLQVQAPWVEHFIRDGSGLTYIYPGTSHVTLGGTRQKGDWNLSPDAENSREILSRCCALEPSLHGACNIREKVGLRPYRPGVRLQTELLARDGRRLPVVHHYGHGSGGISVHWGTALEAARLVSECVHALRTPIAKSKL